MAQVLGSRRLDRVALVNVVALTVTARVSLAVTLAIASWRAHLVSRVLVRSGIERKADLLL